jgi:hypothetical protein
MTDRLESALVSDFNVKYVLQSRLAYEGTFRNNPDERSRDRRLSRRLSDLPLVFRTPWVEVRRNSRWYRPRAHFAEAVVPVPALEEAVRALIRDPGLPRRAAVVETEDPATVVKLAGTGTVVLRYPNEHSVVMDVRSDRGGLVVLHDTVADGWSATVDGKPADIVAVNVLSRGVFVSAGSHRIEMRYLPPVLVAAAGISAATFLAVLLPFVRGRARRS